jgi:hypothetical protein
MEQHDRTPGTRTDEATDGLGIPLSCGKPLCSPGHHHPLCGLSARTSEVDRTLQGIEEAQQHLANAGQGIGRAIDALQGHLSPELGVHAGLARAQRALNAASEQVASSATSVRAMRPQ